MKDLRTKMKSKTELRKSRYKKLALLILSLNIWYRTRYCLAKYFIHVSLEKPNFFEKDGLRYIHQKRLSLEPNNLSMKP